MNANEMADELAKVPIEIFGKVRMIDVRAMLRQQQDKLTKYELRHAEQRDRIAILESQVYGGTTK